MLDLLTHLDRLAFPVTAEQRLAAESVRDFARRRVAPNAALRDRTGEYPMDVFVEACALGLQAMKVSTDDGGGGADNMTYVLAMQSLAEACASTAVILASSNLTTRILADQATPAQRDRWLRPYCAGRLGPASFALSEPGCGSDASALQSTARLERDQWVLNGSKAWTTSGAHAGLHLVFARTDGPGASGISAFVVERGTVGLSVGRDEDKMGQRASGTASLMFDDCRIPADHLVGPRGEGYRIALSALGAGRVGIAALSLGLAEAAFCEGREYVRQRRAFGKRVSDFQNTQFVFADCRTELDAAWLLTLRAAFLLDRGDRASAESSAAKLYATETCGRVVDRMVQVHGGYGYSREYPIEQIYRDARVTRIYEGTSEVQRTVIARSIFRD